MADNHSALVLMAEDDPFDAEYYSAMLTDASEGRYQALCVDSYCKIPAMLDSNDFSALVVDFNLPGTDGITNLKELEQSYPDLPIIVLTGLDDDNIAAESFRLGVQDFLSKEHITPAMFVKSLKYAVERKAILMQLQQALQETAARNKQLAEAATHDELTGLPNRKFFFDETKRAILSAQRQNTIAAVLYFDLDGFKSINDNFGHEVGDQVLIEVGQRVKNVLRSSDLLARLGGDEFVVLIREPKDPVFASTVARHIYEVVSMPMQVGLVNIAIKPSIGISTYPESNSVEELVRHADMAMYEAKQRKDHFVYFYNHQYEEKHRRQHAIERLLSAASIENEFFVCYQPLFGCWENRFVGAEALLRWNSSELGLVDPSEFIPIAEWAKGVDRVFDVVLEHVLALMADQELRMTLRKLSINIGAAQLADKRFCDRLLQKIALARVDPSLLCLEITERQVIENIKHCQTQLHKLKSHGVRIALDDYGTGFSSITHLKQLPIDLIKIDRSLVHELDHSQQDLALTAGIIEMAHRMNMEVVAEGVERQREAEVLKSLGCDYLQGFLYAEPLSEEAFKGLCSG